ncbi:MAG: hypothetical protein ABUS48_05630, partial [Pseudomonadota bacterium]
ATTWKKSWHHSPGGGWVMADETVQKSGPSAAAFGVWSGGATLLGLAGDLAQPLGQIAVFLLGFAIIATVVCGALSLVPGLRKLLLTPAIFSAIGACVFGLVVFLQHATHSDEAGANTGFVAKVVPVAAQVQVAVFKPTAVATQSAPPAATTVEAPAASPSATLLAQLNASLASGDPSEQIRGAREAIASSDAAFRAAAIDKIYRTGDPALRQIAVVALLKDHAVADIPVIITAGTGQSPDLATQLQGRSLDFTNVTGAGVDANSGIVHFGFCGAAGTGMVTRSGLNMTWPCGDAMSVDLHPTDDFRLVGEAHSSTGRVVTVELRLM